MFSPPTQPHRSEIHTLIYFITVHPVAWIHRKSVSEAKHVLYFREKAVHG